MVVRVVEPAMERVPEIVMVAIVCQSLNPSHKQVHMKYVSPPIHGEWHETLYARSPRPFRFIFCEKGVARETRTKLTNPGLSRKTVGAYGTMVVFAWQWRSQGGEKGAFAPPPPIFLE